VKSSRHLETISFLKIQAGRNGAEVEFNMKTADERMGEGYYVIDVVRNPGIGREAFRLGIHGKNRLLVTPHWRRALQRVLARSATPNTASLVGCLSHFLEAPRIRLLPCRDPF
jgi:hypothetical protein